MTAWVKHPRSFATWTNWARQGLLTRFIDSDTLVRRPFPLTQISLKALRPSYRCGFERVARYIWKCVRLCYVSLHFSAPLCPRSSASCELIRYRWVFYEQKYVQVRKSAKNIKNNGLSCCWQHFVYQKAIWIFQWIKIEFNGSWGLVYHAWDTSQLDWIFPIYLCMCRIYEHLMTAAHTKWFRGLTSWRTIRHKCLCRGNILRKHVQQFWRKSNAMLSILMTFVLLIHCEYNSS